MSIEGSPSPVPGSPVKEATAAAAKPEGWRVAPENIKPNFEIVDGKEPKANSADVQTAEKVQAALKSDTPNDVIGHLAAGRFNPGVEEGVFRADTNTANATVPKDTTTDTPVIKIDTAANPDLKSETTPTTDTHTGEDDVVEAEWTDVTDKNNPRDEKNHPLTYEEGYRLMEQEVENRIAQENKIRVAAGKAALTYPEKQFILSLVGQQYNEEYTKRSRGTPESPTTTAIQSAENTGAEPNDNNGSEKRQRIYAVRTGEKGTPQAAKETNPENKIPDNHEQKPAAEQGELLQKVTEIQAQMAVLQKQLTELQVLIAQLNSAAEVNNNKDVSGPETVNNKLLENLASAVIMLGIEMFKALAGIMSELTRQAMAQTAAGESGTAYPPSASESPGITGDDLPELPEGNVAPQLPKPELPSVPQLAKGETPMLPENKLPDVPQLLPPAEVSASAPTI